MRLILETGPTVEPITVDELKLHLRLEGDDFDENSLLTELIKTARDRVQDITNRALLTQTWNYYLQEWPNVNYIVLPFGNLQSVSSIKHKDTDGDETTMTVTDEYIVEVAGEQTGRVVLPYGESWPSGTLYPSNPIAIQFVCGWTTAALLPYKIKTAVKMIAAAMYENRGEAIIGQSMVEDKTADILLASSRLWCEL